MTTESSAHAPTAHAVARSCWELSDASVHRALIAQPTKFTADVSVTRVVSVQRCESVTLAFLT
jgi:hypothetical protein